MRLFCANLTAGAARTVRRICLACGRARCLPGLALACAIAGASPAYAQTVKGDVAVSTDGGYVRIVVKLAEEVESTVKVAGGIIVVNFKRPVDVGIEKVSSAAAEYVGAARRDPDGTGLRIALARKVTVNSMAAGERLFIDLLPENWTGVAPGLPQDVIEDLARRAREAEKLLRAQRQINQKSQRPMRVRVATQPTFTRYVFEMNDVIPVTTDRAKDALVVTFGVPLKFDLTDAKVNLPPVIKAIEGFVDTDASTVRFSLSGVADIRTFREDTNYIVDIGASDAKEGSNEAPKSNTPPLAGLDAPETVPAKGAPAPSGKPQAASSPRAQPAQQNARDKPAEAAAAKPDASPAAPAERIAPAKKSAVEQPAAPQSQQAQAERPKLASAPAPASPAGQPEAAKIALVEPPAAPPAIERQESAEKPAAAAPAAPKMADAVPAAKPAEQPVAASAKVRDPNAVAVEYSRHGDGLELAFPFTAPTPAAMFRRADIVWLVFDTSASIDLNALQADTSNTIKSAQIVSLPDGQVVRLRLERPRLTSVSAEGSSWIVKLGDTIAEPTRPLGIARNVAGSARATATIPIDQPRKLYRVADPDIGDTLLVVTALAPARGFLKAQDFVEFRLLASTQGVVVQPIADDVHIDLSADKIVIARPAGLTLSGSVMSERNSVAFRPVVFDAQLWGFDKQSNFTERQYKLIAAAADAGDAKRGLPRMELARFYLSRDMFVEAKGVLDVMLAEERPTADNPTGLVLRAIANIMLNRPDEALKELSDPLIGDQFDAPLWRAFAYARQGKWPEARTGFRNVEASIATLPIELQQLALREAMRAAIEVRDFSGATDKLHEFETIGMPRQMQPMILVLTGRLAHGLGKNEDALKAFRAAAETGDRPAAAQGQLREIALRYGLGDLKRVDVISELETLTALWRGDETEIEALQILARLYTEENRYRDAFHVMRTALKAHPNSEMTRRIQEEAAVTFDSLFLAGKGDTLPAIDALSLFYDFRELTPIGRRGDEMIRRLADRLVSVDLLYQASELLQHQIDNRLQGAARSQVATRLAVVYLMDRKAEKALSVLKATRMAELSNELRTLRLLLEARALSDMKRTDLALEVIANIDRREAIRLRADILWAGKRYGESAEQIELLYGERWKDFEPLGETERADILRAAIGYALSEDAIGLGRLREKYTPKMIDAPDRRAFEIATAPFGANASEFREVSKMVAASDTLGNFLREMRAGYPELGAMSGVDPASLPKLAPQKAAATKPLVDAMPTGSILPDQRKLRR